MDDQGSLHQDDFLMSPEMGSIPNEERPAGNGQSPKEVQSDSIPPPILPIIDSNKDRLQIKDIQAELHRLGNNDQHELAKKIKERTPKDLEHNYTNALHSLLEEYRTKSGDVNQRQTVRSHLRGIFRKPHDEIKEMFEDKAGEFREAFDVILFPHIEHSAPNTLPDEMELKSPPLLAKESGKSVEEESHSSGTLDQSIGNTDYVFANFNSMPSRSFNRYGRNFEIISTDGYAVPIDIADLKALPSMAKDGNYRTSMLEAYANNIFTLSQFKEVFSAYAAVFFDTPEDALLFFNRYTESQDISRADFWESDIDSKWGSSGLTEAEKAEDSRRFNQMRSFFEKTGIYPPFCPEIQFKDKVSAKRKLEPTPLPNT